DICSTCLVGNNRDKKKGPLKIVPVISEVYGRLNIDAVGPLIPSSRDNRYLITSICVASKYPDAIPVQNLSSKSVIQALIQIFSRSGYPKEIQCDLGRSFTSELTSEFFSKFGIKVYHSSVCHPQSNSVERLHSTLKRVLKALCLEGGQDWEENLPSALFALRTVSHESTGFSPSELVHGKNLRTPQTIVYENWLDEESSDPTVVEYVLDLVNRLKKCQELAVDRMKECQTKRKLWYDRNAVTRKFKVGDLVLVLATSKPHKMAVNWIGPGKVTSVISETNYTVEIPGKRNSDTIFHVNLMKPYHQRPEFVNLVIEEVEKDIEGDADIPYPLADPTQVDFWKIVEENRLEDRVSAEEIGKFQEIIGKYGAVFSSDPGCTPLVEMDIKLLDETPVRARPYRMSQRQICILKEEIRRLLELGVIEVGQSDYASPMILVEVPGKDPRPCIDYRKLNAKTMTEFFPLPNIEEVVEKVSAAPFITIMDLTKGYFQIPLTERAQRYAAFVTPFGSFIPKKMMFGLLNAPFYFCKLIAQVLGGLEHFVLPYLDDFAVFSPTWERHMTELEIVLGRLQEAKLTVKPSKCRFAQDHVKFLGHEVGSGKRSPSEAKIQAIRDFPTPTTKTNIRSYLGTVGYYARYIKDYARIALPLTEALKGKNKKEKVDWTKECDESFNALKDKLVKSPVLYAPNYDKEFIVQTDASLYGAGVVLSQIQDGEEHPILYLSKKFSSAERNYSTVERELAAIIYGLKKLNHYLDGQKFTIQTDHNPLTFLNKMMGNNSRLIRWALCLQQYNFEITHRPGRLHGNADGLSRALV
ncbi:MAG: reverse transcriptase domain-containing protein, partial [Asgard group archaeon]|nr:reverse transcriptase domain-containing protein [Asgard group archaeon]